VNPSARLPFTVPVDEADLPAFDRDATTFTYDRWHGWWRASRHDIAPAYPFGFGLSYTTFALADVSTTVHGPAVVVRGTVCNTGDRDGTDVVQVYAQLPDTEAPDRLIGFTRVQVAAADRAEFEIVVPLDLLSTRDSAQRTWQPATGTHRIITSRFAGDPDASITEVHL
jgi:beta-glucosidase